MSKITEQYAEQVRSVLNDYRTSLIISDMCVSMVWTEFYTRLMKNQRLFRFSIGSAAKRVNKLMWRSEGAWGRHDEIKGYSFAVGDYGYEFLKEDISALQCRYQTLYRDATFKNFELLSWMHLTMVLINSSMELYEWVSKDLKEKHRIKIGLAFADNDMTNICKLFDKLYKLIWNQEQFNRIDNDRYPLFSISQNPDILECTALKSLRDMDSIKSVRNIVEKCLSEEDEYGYKDLG